MIPVEPTCRQNACSKVTSISLFDLLPGIELLPIRLEDIRYLGYRHGRIMMTPPNDLVALCLIAQYFNARALFEIGTHLGLTTLQLAINTDEDARIYTMDLPTHERFFLLKKCIINGESDSVLGDVGHHFNKTESTRKITQIRANSFTYDFARYADEMDFVFIDGNHSYPCVKRDSESAFQMLGERGVILWHDFNVFSGVNQCLEELSEIHELWNLRDCNLAMYKRGT